MRNTLLAIVFLGGLTLGGRAFAADHIELTDGSVLYGKLLSMEAGKFKIQTAFAGTLEIALDKVKSFATDEPVNVALTGGGPVTGRVEAADSGIRIVAGDSPVTAGTGRITAVWRKDADSPEARKVKAAAAGKVRHWSIEASASVAGRTGVTEKFGADLGLKATLANATDKLVLTYQAQRAKDNGVETADREYGGADFSSFINSPDYGWFARTSLEQDRIKLLDLRSNTSVGFGHKLIKNPKQDLEARVGVNYVYENYANHTSFESPGLDFSVLHSYQFKTSKLTDAISYMPAFKEFSNFRVHQESAFEIPLLASLWKLKLGLANDFNSKPPDHVEHLDTTYFTSLLLNWK